MYPNVSDHSTGSQRVISLNVGGTLFTTSLQTLKKDEESTLAGINLMVVSWYAFMDPQSQVFQNFKPLASARVERSCEVFVEQSNVLYRHVQRRRTCELRHRPRWQVLFGQRPKGKASETRGFAAIAIPMLLLIGMLVSFLQHFATILNYLRDGECDLPTDSRERRELSREAEHFEVSSHSRTMAFIHFMMLSHCVSSCE